MRLTAFSPFASHTSTRNPKSYTGNSHHNLARSLRDPSHDGWFSQADVILLGRTTYQMMEKYWSQVTDPDNVVATQLNTRPKYVVSTTMASASWPNSTIIGSGVLDRVAGLKARPVVAVEYVSLDGVMDNLA